MKISVITPCYFAGETLERAISSVQIQDYLNWEHIIIDGASTDRTGEILRSFEHLRWISEPDCGQSHAMNKGFERASGDIIVFLNADDYFLQGAFSSVIKEFRHGAKFVVGNVLVKSERLGRTYVNRPRIALEDMLRHWLPNSFCYNSVGYFYLREVQEQCPFNVKNEVSMDLEFLLDAAAKFTFTKIEATLGCYVETLTAKTHRAQSAPGFWCTENFSFIDKHIQSWPEVTRQIFLRQREIGYRKISKYWRRMEYQRRFLGFLSSIKRSKPGLE